MNPLITVPELRQSLATGPRPTLIDVRWSPTGPPGIKQFHDGHLPGALYADLDADLAAPPGPRGRHPLPDPSSFTKAMRGLGVRGNRRVVVYDARDSTVAARLWWMLRYFGHPDVRVLDGGFQAWRRAGETVETGPAVSPPEPGDFSLGVATECLIGVDDVPGFAERGILLDARQPERFRGDVEPMDPVAGHIPGAVSAPTSVNVDDDGLFRPAPELRRRFTDLGVGADVEVAAYCGSGVTAAHEVLALRLAGFDAALYAGSWSEWISDPTRAVAHGD